MTSSTHANTPGFKRLTASDRPGVAQPVPEREVPDLPWIPILLIACLLALAMLAAWEWHWRAYGVLPSHRNSDGAWAQQRRRIDSGEADALVLVGSSRVLFDVQLPEWEKATGTRPIQLALEGTSPVPILEDLAANSHFKGRLLIGVAPDLFFSGFAVRGDVVNFYHDQGPSQRSGHWLSQNFLEPYFAFYAPDFALATVINRQPWPARTGVNRPAPVRKLSMSDADRNTTMWQKVETDMAYRTMARNTWAERFNGPRPEPMNTPEKMQKVIETQIARAETAVKILRARGVRLLFLRPPSSGDYYAFENSAFPRASTWDALLRRTAAKGIHFEDYPEFQGLDLPEWSHLSAVDARKFTRALAPMVEQAFRDMEPANASK